MLFLRRQPERLKKETDFCVILSDKLGYGMVGHMFKLDRRGEGQTLRRY